MPLSFRILRDAVISTPPAGGFVLPLGKAWAYSTGGGKRKEGYIFLADKRVFYIDSGSSLKEPWSIKREGSYYISSSGYVNVVWKDAEHITNLSYTASGNALILAGMVYAKASGVNITIPDVVNNLVLDDGYGWARTVEDDGYISKDGYIFLADGRVFRINSSGEDDWTLNQNSGWYETSGSLAAVTFYVYQNSTYTYYYSYTIAYGYTLTLVNNNSGYENVYTKTWVGNIEIPPPSSSKSRAGAGVSKALAKK